MFSARDLLILSRISHVGPRRVRSLTEGFRDLRTLSSASPRQLCRIPGIRAHLAERICRFFRSGEILEASGFADAQLHRLRETGGKVISMNDDVYPSRLSEIYDPPPVLFLAGMVPDPLNDAVAIVGTRGPSPYGRSMAEYFSRELSRVGIVIVSGMARGIDTVVHETVLREGGRTIAVTGTGLDISYPPENRKLGREIAESGTVMTEFPFGTGPDAGNFPRRNRIISGLCRGTIVVESDVDGGAMITARLALDQNREVFAVPGYAASPRSAGCHRLIREGRAKLIDRVADVMDELGGNLRPCLGTGQPERRPETGEMSDEDDKLGRLLEAGPLHIDELAEASGMEIPVLHLRLITLEMKNLVRQLPGKYYMKAP